MGEDLSRIVARLSTEINEWTQLLQETVSCLQEGEDTNRVRKDLQVCRSMLHSLTFKLDACLRVGNQYEIASLDGKVGIWTRAKLTELNRRMGEERPPSGWRSFRLYDGERQVDLGILVRKDHTARAYLPPAVEESVGYFNLAGNLQIWLRQKSESILPSDGFLADKDQTFLRILVCEI